MDLLLASGLHLRGELNARASLVARAVSLSMSTPVPLRTVTSTTGARLSRWRHRLQPGLRQYRDHHASLWTYIPTYALVFLFIGPVPCSRCNSNVACGSGTSAHRGANPR